MKRIMTIQDISCIGKCSLTVALPIISSFGIETAIVPTAILSTHTQFSGFTFRDLTDDMEPIREHWKKEGFEFSAIYTGYLGSERQIAIVREYIKDFKSGDTMVIVDPVMADNGKLYAGFDDSFPKKMAGLCKEADVILPNLSEAALMLGVPYPGEDAAPEVTKKLLKGLAEFCGGLVVITGVTLADKAFGYMGLDVAKNEFFEYGNPKVPFKSHGTGDIFASTFTGAAARGIPTCDALRLAADYVTACIKNTYEDPNRVNYAVNFEAELPGLHKMISERI
ncbi:MAG: pyridoxamine kinase [Lachnospiraceae bacterium]|jgi:pyridoxine kinase|nr:pyridoxamine kinase [Lachnospiraceae bacterium]MCR5499629.1 pyridoxamine kinase [Acetatifactor sp.]